MNNISSALMVAAGGATGALLRWVVAAGVTSWVGGAHWGILGANLLGCFAIGFFQAGVSVADLGSPEARLFLFTGLIGAFTTYSTFNYHIIELWNESKFAALAYILITFLGGLVLYIVSYALGTRLFS